MKTYIELTVNRKSIELFYNTENETGADMPFIDNMSTDMLQGVSVTKEDDSYIAEGVNYIVEGNITQFLYFLKEVKPKNCPIVFVEDLLEGYIK